MSYNVIWHHMPSSYDVIHIYDVIRIYAYPYTGGVCDKASVLLKKLFDEAKFSQRCRCN
jgi:hypothetical protein